MDLDRDVIDRLERIERLEHAGAPAAVLLMEVRGLLHAAEQLARHVGDELLDETVVRCRGALAAGAEPESANHRRLVAAVDRAE